MIPSANIIPALGPPMLPMLILTLNGNTKLSPTCTPTWGAPPTLAVFSVNGLRGAAAADGQRDRGAGLAVPDHRGRVVPGRSPGCRRPP